MHPTLRNGILLSIILISFLMHFKHFSKDLMSVHVWRQTQTQSTIINFYEEDMNIFNPRRNLRGNGDGIFRMEFPLMQWLVAGGYKIGGNHIEITRGFMFLMGLFSVCGIYFLSLQLFQKEELALIGAWTFNFSPCFYYYTINPLPDNMALCCTIWGMGLFFSWYKNERTSHLILSGILLSIGALCKLPFIIYFIIPVVYFGRKVFQKEITTSLFQRVISTFIWAIFPLSWYAWVIPQWKGNPVVEGMLNNQVSVSTLLDYAQHHLLITLPEQLLNYAAIPFFITGFYYLFKRKAYQDHRFLLIVACCGVVLFYFLFELNAIAKVHDYYLFPFYPLLFLLVAYGGYHLLLSKRRFIRYASLSLLMIIPLTCYLRMDGRWNPNKPGFNKDLWTYKTELRTAVPKDALVVVGNDVSQFIFFYYIDKKGWGFNNDDLTANQLKNMIQTGAQYLYTDSKTITNQPAIQQQLKELIIERGSIQVYSLKE